MLVNLWPWKAVSVLELSPFPQARQALHCLSCWWSGSEHTEGWSRAEGYRRQPRCKRTMEQLFLLSQLLVWKVEVPEHSLSPEEPGKVILFTIFRPFSQWIRYWEGNISYRKAVFIFFFMIEHRRMSSIWTFVKTLTWSSTTSFSLNWRHMDLMGALFSGWGISWMVASRG